MWRSRDPELDEAALAEALAHGPFGCRGFPAVTRSLWNPVLVALGAPGVIEGEVSGGAVVLGDDGIRMFAGGRLVGLVTDDAGAAETAREVHRLRPGESEQEGDEGKQARWGPIILRMPLPVGPTGCAQCDSYRSAVSRGCPGSGRKVRNRRRAH